MKNVLFSKATSFYASQKIFSPFCNLIVSDTKRGGRKCPFCLVTFLMTVPADKATKTRRLRSSWWSVSLGIIVKIVRKGFPGKNREILLTYSLSNIRSIGIKITDGLNPNRNLYLCLKDDRIIPLTLYQEPVSISDIEEKAANLAKFLNLKLETL